VTVGRSGEKDTGNVKWTRKKIKEAALADGLLTGQLAEAVAMMVREVRSEGYVGFPSVPASLARNCLLLIFPLMQLALR
jgi:hypothetical protein